MVVGQHGVRARLESWDRLFMRHEARRSLYESEQASPEQGLSSD
jgi:hypothetical protein